MIVISLIFPECVCQGFWLMNGGVETKLCSPLGAFAVRGGAFHVAGIAFCTCAAFLDVNFTWQAQ